MASAYGAQSPAPGTSVDSAPAAQARRNASSWPVRPSGGQHAGEHVARAGGVDGVDGGRGHVEPLVLAKVARAARAAGDHQMRYGPMPFARLGLVDHDDVGQFGQRQQVVGSAPAGDALTITTAPAARATRAAATAVAIGISSCSSTTSLSAMTARTSAEVTLRWALAPGATTMVFSAAASTMITAEPLGPGR